MTTKTNQKIEQYRKLKNFSWNYLVKAISQNLKATKKILFESTKKLETFLKSELHGEDTEAEKETDEKIF